MPRITPEEKENILDLIKTYRKLHDRIAETEEGITRIEQELKRLYTEKDAIIAQMQANRDRETSTVNNLVEKYGNGKLNIDDMVWLPKENDDKQIEQNNEDIISSN